MGKVLKPLLLVAAVAVNVIPGAGQAISAGIFAATGVTVGAAAALAATTAAIGIAGSAIKTGGKSAAAAAVSSFDPKSINVDPAAKRKMVFGRTAFPLDLRYGEPSGTGQDYIDYVFALAAHRSDGIEEIWIEDKLAWTSAGGAQGIYAGYLTIEVILEGGAGAYHTVNAGAGWGAAQRMTGCTTMKVRVKRSNNSASSTSPFANGIAGRWTVIGRGMPLYDPALDSSVAGGSGSQRADDCTTWRYTAGSVERGRNHALQLLAYLLGYRINGVVSVGLGMSPALIDLASFATSAARCDEAVTLVAGGSQRRYEGGAAFADDHEPESVMGTLLAAMNAELIDDGGRIGLRVAVNDLTAAITLTDDDIQGGFNWNPVQNPAEQFTVVRGRFQQPNAPSLFGMADYPDVAVPRTSPAPRPLPLDLAAVQDVRRAERIAKQVGQRSLYQGMFTCRIGIRGWYLRRNMIVAWTSEARAWSGKLFRVRSLRFNIDATVDVTFREENAAVYQWDNAETGNVSPVTPTTYDPRNAPWIQAVGAAATTANWSGVNDDGGKPANNADVTADALSKARFNLQAPSARVGIETRKRFDPIFWTCNFPSTMIAAVRATAADEITLDAVLFERGHLCGLIWESVDTHDHPTTGYDTNKDYRNCTMTFRLRLSGNIQTLAMVSGPTLTIEGRTAGGTPFTNYVYLSNAQTSGSATDGMITLNFNSLPGGFYGSDTIYTGDIDRMFISMVPYTYLINSTTKLGTPDTGNMRLSNIAVTGSNSTMVCGLGPGGVHEVRMTNGYDDTYNVAPSRIVRNCQLLGYKGEFNHYVGMSHYFQWLWNGTESRYIAQDVALPLNTPCLLWHQGLAAALQSAGMTLIWSLSYEMLNGFAPLSWRQLDASANPALSGWSPPSAFLSPCNTTAMAYLQKTAKQFASISDAIGMPVHFQVGEPWYWIDFATYVPYFYDTPTTSAYLTATGLSAPTITSMTATMSAAQLAYLDWLGTKLAASVLDLLSAVRSVYPLMTSYVLLYLPQLINSATPESARVNMPAALAYPAVDILQLEDYDFVIAGREDLSATARGVAEKVLGYPRSRQQYFAGFALNRDTSDNIWRNSSTAVQNAYDWGIFPVFIWAYTQVIRDGYIPRIKAAPAIAMRDIKDVALPPPGASDRQGLRYDSATRSWKSGIAPILQIPTLNFPWINYGSGFLGARYYKTDEGVVVMEGLIQAPAMSPVVGVTLFTLLPGYRPSGTLMFITANGGGSGRIDVDSAGNVVMQSGNTAFTSLALSFLAA